MTGPGTIAVGRWKIHVSSPHPVWCVIEYEGTTVGNIRHTDLRDLEYALGRAIKAARDALPEPYKNEMD